MLSPEQIKEEQAFHEKEIITLLSKLSNLFHFIQMHKEYVDYHPEDYELDEMEFEFKENAEKLINITSIYIERKGSPTATRIFNELILLEFKERKNLLKGRSYDSDYVSSALVDEYWKLVSLFPAFNVMEGKDTKFEILENILKATPFIINSLGKNPISETQVYTDVDVFVKVTFPEAELIPINTSFSKTAKHYQPDILIPSLRCAIEYKYANDKPRLVETIDQIHIDVYGYSMHPLYDTFYAVFYAKTGIITHNEFDLIWRNKKFPANWKPILVFGNFGTKKPKLDKPVKYDKITEA